jgi:hypothetical protein
MSVNDSAAQVRVLDDILVIDTSSFLAGPFCTTQLAEFGAEVIKIELPKVGDALRKFGTITESGDSLPWLSECRNKKSITLDLRKPDGAALVKRLVGRLSTSAFMSQSSVFSTSWHRPIILRATCVSAWGPAPLTSSRTATTRPRTTSGSQLLVPTTRSLRGWPVRWAHRNSQIGPNGAR